MMMKYRITDTFETTAEKFWQVFFDENYTRALYARLKIDYQRISQDTQRDGRVTRTLRLSPTKRPNGVLSHVTRRRISYIECSTFDPASECLTIHTRSTPGSTILKNYGQFYLEPRARNVVRIWAGICQCSLPLIGHAIERHLVKEIQRSYRQSTRFTQEWLARDAS